VEIREWLRRMRPQFKNLVKIRTSRTERSLRRMFLCKRESGGKAYRREEDRGMWWYFGGSGSTLLVGQEVFLEIVRERRLA